jgi:hypothetical protein
VAAAGVVGVAAADEVAAEAAAVGVKVGIAGERR